MGGRGYRRETPGCLSKGGCTEQPCDTRSVGAHLHPKQSQDKENDEQHDDEIAKLEQRECQGADDNIEIVPATGELEDAKEAESAEDLRVQADLEMEIVDEDLGKTSMNGS